MPTSKDENSSAAGAAPFEKGQTAPSATRTTYAAKPWEMTYAHNRRKHRHRCRCCGRILNAGDRVLMAKVANRRTWALHITCADRPNGTPDDPAFTWRDSFNAWAKPVPHFCGTAKAAGIKVEG